MTRLSVEDMETVGLNVEDLEVTGLSVKSWR